MGIKVDSVLKIPASNLNLGNFFKQVEEPVFIVHEESDAVTPVSEIKKAAENSTNNIKAWFTTGQDHNLTKTETVVTIINHITNTHKNKEELCT